MKLLSIMIVLALALSAAAPVWADDTDTFWEQPPIKKLGRGFVNILDATVEVPGTMIRTSEEKGAGGMFEGFFYGLINTGKRLVVGAYEVITFPFPVPSDYDPILDDPKFLNKE